MQIINLVNQDAEGLAGCLGTVIQFVTLPFSIVIGVVYLGMLIGISMWSSAGLVAITLFATFLNGPVMERIFDLEMEATDNRITIMREVIYGMFSIKANALEDWFRSLIQTKRDQEVFFVRKGFVVALLCQTFASVTSVLMPLASLSIFAALGNALEPNTIITALYLLQNLSEPMIQTNYFVQNWLYISNHWNRLSNFLIATEHEPWVQIEMKDAIVMSDIVWKYLIDVEDPLQDIFEAQPFQLRVSSLVVPRKKKVAVVGPVGSGKSTFLYGSLGNILLQTGSIQIGGMMSYTSQQPWLMSGSIKDIVTMGTPFDHERLKEVLYVSCLEEDLARLSNGIETQVGESGVNLSGGQQSRLALARALYRDADLYLLDSPLEALDSTIGKLVLERLFEFLKDKTLIMCTHNALCVENFDMVLVMDKGTLIESKFQDTPSEKSNRPLILSNSDLAKELNDHSVEDAPKLKRKKTDDKVWLVYPYTDNMRRILTSYKSPSEHRCSFWV
jgi:ABC-type bacteriocin/lantibiotic exporter with double-glycine peptidase domain